MQFVRISSLILSMLFITFASSNKIETAKQLAEIMGLKQILQNQSKLTSTQVSEQTKTGLGNMHKTIHITDQSFWNEMDSAFAEFGRSASLSINVDSAISKWAELYAQEFTEGALDSSIAFYKSSLGQKILSAELRVTGKWQESINSMISEKISQCSSILQNRIQKIISKYKDKLKQ